MGETEVIKGLMFLKEKLYNGIFQDRLECIDLAIAALEEVQKYRQIGTVEECREAVEKQNSKKLEEFVDIVEKWSAEHLAKTKQSEFLKMFPDVKTRNDVIDIGPCVIDTKNMKDRCRRHGNCSDCRKKYWLEEVE